MTEKKCSKCSEIKPLEEFCIQTRSKDGRASYCKVCKAKADREYRDRKGEELLEKKRAYYAENKEMLLARESLSRKEQRSSFKEKESLLSKEQRGYQKESNG